MTDNPNSTPDLTPGQIRQIIEQTLQSWQWSGLEELPKYDPQTMDRSLELEPYLEPEPVPVPEPGLKSEPESDLKSEVELKRDLNSIPVQNMTNPTETSYSHIATLPELAQVVSQCRLCPALADTRTQTVFGVGNPSSRLMFLGEAPGADEDAMGIPFVGRSGKLLTDMIQNGMRISREDVYICNILRCRPPDNRNPSSEEAACCRPFLERQIELVNPEFICCLGAVAAQNLLNTTVTIGKLRGRVHDWKGRKVICTYHPSYLLRSPNMKKEAWIDLQLLMKEMGLDL